MATNSETPVPAVSLRQFFESVPPGTISKISDLGANGYWDGSAYIVTLAKPDILLFCDSKECNGYRFFSTDEEASVQVSHSRRTFVTYICKNCTAKTKTYAISFTVGEDRKAGHAHKYGEVPAFGPPTPARLISLIGPQKSLFLKGRRAENQGMGIAAFAYYRRVIEGQKDRIFDEVIKVSRRLSAGQTVIDELVAAKGETQFIKAVEAVKHGIPQALLITGRNPLTLLHSALSEGLHAQSDEDCLEIATSIRVVMAEFAERMAEVIKEEAELSAAVSRLLQKKASAKPSGQAADPNPPTSN